MITFLLSLLLPLLLPLLLGLGALGMAAYARNEFAPTQGQEEFIFSAPASATEVDIGDCVYQDPITRQPKPASGMLNQGTLLLNQDAFQQYFLGVSEQRSKVGQTDKVRIAVRGVKNFDCVSAQYKVGDLLGLDNQASGTALEDRKVRLVTSLSHAIAICTEDTPVASTKVWGRFESTIMYGGLQAQAVGSSSGAI